MTKVAPTWHPLAAFVLPFMVFIVATSIENLESLKSWYPLLYGIKNAAILAVLCWGRPWYPAWSTKGLGIGLIFGLVGGVAWVVLCTWNFENSLLPAVLATVSDWFNMPSIADWLKPGSRVGYNPFSELSPAAAWTFAFIRLIGLMIVVPIMEELFWRGFLNRALINDDWRDIFNENWQSVPWGKISPFSLAIVTIFFIASHPEWTAALVWSLGIMFVYWYTRNLWACIVAHAASNAVLGYYILAHEQWQLW